ncbi:helix-turn-helix transcriptional regulator [Natronosalvus amylolyticus]|uniref:helix-turn-helix transcriptional regulator n=1 Tax=Natronosalvus amylolyticus TaxID=2961994 RepID=UPI0020CA15AA|nr:winged helix-turn-helix domain-containing protein [Natronosalvus amylolyticus]
MAVAQQHVSMDADDLRPADQEILDELQHGRATKGALVDWTSYSRNTIYNRLEVLEAAGYVECVHEGTRLFELVEDPREHEDSTN